jgi:3-deoxy-D-manno-octulosonic-acid transferase
VHTNFFKALLPEKNIQTLTDTRFDRIINQIELSRKEPVLNKDIFQNNQLILIAGSTWEPDEILIWLAYNDISPDLRSNLRLIFVPHEPTYEHLKKFNDLCGNVILLSKLLENIELIDNNTPDTPIIVDSIGKLLRLYGIADFAYVGGGFGVGIHSVTEPAGYGIPIATGPKINNSPDAINLMKLGSLYKIHNSREFQNWLNLMIKNEEMRLKAGNISREYIFRNSGSTPIVVKKILDLM